MQVNVFTIQLVLIDIGQILIYLMVGNYSTSVLLILFYQIIEFNFSFEIYLSDDPWQSLCLKLKNINNYIPDIGQ